MKPKAGNFNKWRDTHKWKLASHNATRLGGKDWWIVTWHCDECDTDCQFHVPQKEFPDPAGSPPTNNELLWNQIWINCQEQLLKSLHGS